MKKYDVVIFDLDGTLIDTIQDLGEAVNHSLRVNGRQTKPAACVLRPDDSEIYLPLHTLNEYRLMVGNGVRKLVQRALPDHLQEDDAFVDKCLKDFKDYYTDHIDVHTRPYAGMPELLTKLQAEGVTLAVASNKFQSGTEHLVKEFFPDINFIRIFGNREGYPLKPDPEIVNEVLRAAGESTEGPLKAILVGDSATDIKTARNGGIPVIAVSWGFRPKEDLADADKIVDSVSDLENDLLG